MHNNTSNNKRQGQLYIIVIDGQIDNNLDSSNGSLCDCLLYCVFEKKKRVILIYRNNRRNRLNNVMISHQRDFPQKTTKEYSNAKIPLGRVSADKRNLSSYVKELGANSHDESRFSTYLAPSHKGTQ